MHTSALKIRSDNCKFQSPGGVYTKAVCMDALLEGFDCSPRLTLTRSVSFNPLFYGKGICIF